MKYIPGFTFSIGSVYSKKPRTPSQIQASVSSGGKHPKGKFKPQHQYTLLHIKKCDSGFEYIFADSTIKENIVEIYPTTTIADQVLDSFTKR